MTAHLPFPPASGGRRREFELISRLAIDFDVHLCSLTETPEIDNRNAGKLMDYCKHISIFKTGPSPLANGTSRYSSLLRRYYSREGFDGISKLIRSPGFDIIHIEGSYLMQLIPENCPVPILLVEHNVEYSLYLQRLRLSTSESDRSFYHQEYDNTLLWERLFWKRAQKVISLTPEDERHIRDLEPSANVTFIPNGVDHYLTIDRANAYSPSNGKTGPASVHFTPSTIENCHPILFVGNFAYDPNVDAAIFLCREILPLVVEKVPNAKLFIVGNSPPSELLDLVSSNNSSTDRSTDTSEEDKPDANTIHDHIEITGYVDSLEPFYKYAKVVVCPLRVGGGVKVKILEALRAGKAIVTTPIGAQGFGLNNEALCVCSLVSDFANNVVRFLINPYERKRQERRALRFANTLPTWDQVIEQYLSCYESLVSKTLTKNINIGHNSIQHRSTLFN
ncbi:MAG TPA: glycosyltransferase family 4 protein [Nitrososphaeraceae archaeon]|nr:glycosyltransferase family 4 protein [Nitrososphaeraceae archaeon]